MQPRQARRGTTAIAASTLMLGVLLVVLAFVLTACGGSTPSVATTSPSASPSASSTAPATTAPPTSAPPTTAPATTAPPGTPTDAGLGTRPAVPVASAATFVPGITATVITIEPITATASLPGEIAGPAVRLTVAVQNASSGAVDLGNVTVDLQDASKSSATPLSGNGSKPFTGTAPPGDSATGVYVFSLPVADRAGVSLYVTCNADLPVVVFTGDLS